MNRRLVVALAVCVVCSGCGKKASETVAEKMIEASMAKDGVKADVDLSKETVTVKTKDGTMSVASGKSVKLPDNLPKDVYVYEGATLVSVMTVPDGFNLNLQSKDSADKVVETCKAKVAADGWKEETSFVSAGQSMLSFSKEGRTLSLMVAKSDDQTQINMTVMTPKRSASAGGG